MAAQQAPDRFLVGLATLTLLADAAEAPAGALPWSMTLSGSIMFSLQMLAFVCRRLLAERVGVLFGCARRGRGTGAGGLPAARHGPIAEDAGRELLRISAGAEMAEPVARRALADAAGYPLALIELGRDLAEGSGAAP